MEVTGMELHGKSVFGGIAMGRLSVYHKTDNAVKRTKITDIEAEKKRFEDAKTYARLGRITALIFAGLTLSFLYIFRDRVASLYGNDSQFIETTAVFLTYSLFFQLADTFAAPLQGILRGYKDTIVPFYLGLIGYWGVAIPLGYLLDQATDLGAYAYWIGLIASLIVTGILYQIRLKQVEKKS